MRTSYPQKMSQSLLVMIAIVIGLVSNTLLKNVNSAEEQDSEKTEKKEASDSKIPQITKTVPKDGADDVDPSLKEVRVTFNRDMSKGMSWTGEIPVDTARKAKWIDKRTCVLPVKLEPETSYRIGINSVSFQNFRSEKDVPADSSAIEFTTKKAGAAKTEKPSKDAVPKIVKLEPENDATDVDPDTKDLKVTFDIPMGSGMSWTGGGPNFPNLPKGKKAKWSNDGKTCTLPVALEPDHEYELGINSLSFKNFRSKHGIPAEPVVYKFHTAEVKNE